MDGQRAAQLLAQRDPEAAFPGAVIQQLADAELLEQLANQGRVLERGDAVGRVLVQRLLLAPVFLGN